MTYRAPLRWLRIERISFKSWVADSTHAIYEVRSYKPKVWRAYRNGRLMSPERWMSRNAAIAFIEARYYDGRQMPTVVNVRRKNAAR